MEGLLDGTYVINMDSDVDRLNEFDDMMLSSNWNYSRFPAINGKTLFGSWSDLDSDEYEHMSGLLSFGNKYISGSSWLSKSEMGCLLSHVSLWNTVATDPSKNRIAIFEDDARTHLDGNTIYKLLRDFYSYLSENNISEPDMLYLGKALDDCINYEKVWGNVYKSRHPICLHSYIITKSGAQKLLSLAPFHLPIDVVPINAIENNIINVMVFHPSLFFQDVLNNVSNLRKLNGALNHTSECMVTLQHLSSDTWNYTFVIIIGLISAILLYVFFTKYF